MGGEAKVAVRAGGALVRAGWLLGERVLLYRGALLGLGALVKGRLLLPEDELLVVGRVGD